MRKTIEDLAEKCAKNSKEKPDISKVKSLKKAVKSALATIGLIGIIGLGTEEYVNEEANYKKQQVQEMQEVNKKIQEFRDMKKEILQAKKEYEEKVYPLNSELFDLTDEEAWLELTDDLLNERPGVQNPKNADEIYRHMSGKMQEITVKVRGWKDEEGLEREDKEMTIKVNEELADIWKSFFEDIYNEAPDFVITELSGYRIDAIGGGQVGAQSGHDYGAAIDINPSVNYLYKKPLTKEEWEKLPESRRKYEEIYIGSSVEKIADRYTLSWGGEWISKKDNMHFSFMSDKSRDDLIKIYKKERDAYLEHEEEQFQEQIKEIANKYLGRYGMSEYEINFENFENILNKENTITTNTKDKGKEGIGNDQR